MSESITPAPREISEALESELAPALIARAIAGALTADAVTKSGARIPDHRTRLAAAELALNYLVGRPAQRTETLNINVDAQPGIDLVERLRSSPALREQLRKHLTEADPTVDSGS